MYENCPTNLNNKITIKYKCLGSKPQVFNHNSGFMKAEVDVDCRSRIPVIQNQTQRDHGAVRKSDNKFIKLSVTNIRCVGLIEEDQGRVFLRRWNLIWSWSFQWQWSAAISIQWDTMFFFLNKPFDTFGVVKGNRDHGSSNSVYWIEHWAATTNVSQNQPRITFRSVTAETSRRGWVNLGGWGKSSVGGLAGTHKVITARFTA